MASASIIVCHFASNRRAVCMCLYFVNDAYTTARRTCSLKEAAAHAASHPAPYAGTQFYDYFFIFYVWSIVKYNKATHTHTISEPCTTPIIDVVYSLHLFWFAERSWALGTKVAFVSPCRNARIVSIDSKYTTGYNSTSSRVCIIRLCTGDGVRKHWAFRVCTMYMIVYLLLSVLVLPLYVDFVLLFLNVCECQFNKYK